MGLNVCLSSAFEKNLQFFICAVFIICQQLYHSFLKTIYALTHKTPFLRKVLQTVYTALRGVFPLYKLPTLPSVKKSIYEKTMLPGPDGKSIRLDVHTSDSQRDFDIEIQTTLYKELRERTRYYQSLMDVDSLKKGHSYEELKDNIIIFICLEDLFGLGLPVYTFENICRENSSLKLEDRTLKVFYNCSSWQNVASKEKAEFLKFLLTDNAESSLCKKLKEREKQIKMTARAQKEYMDYCMLKQACIDYGKAEGYKQGEEHAKLEAARNLINLDVSLDIIAQAQALPLETVQQIAKELETKA